MAYDQDFYKIYADYLVEPRVRTVHDRILTTVCAATAFRRIADLGCGQGHEFFKYGRPDFYVGIDYNAIHTDQENFKTVAADYRDAAAIGTLTNRFNLKAIVSLFSIECTAARDKNQAYYKSLFKQTGADAILAAGFHYQHAYGQETVGEAGGLISYQTFADIPDASSVFQETRIAVACPSTLFGEDVTEIWRLMQRANKYDVALDKNFTALSPNAAARAVIPG